MNDFSPRQNKSEVKNVQGISSNQTPTNDSSSLLNASFHQHILQMQRQLGNRRVMQLLRSEANTSSQASSMLIQKKDIDYTEKKPAVYSEYEKLNNRPIILEIPKTDLANYTFASVLKDKYRMKNLPVEFQVHLETGENKLVVHKFSSNPSSKKQSTTITIEIKHPRDFTERGDLSKIMKFGTEFTFTNDAMIAESKKKGDGGVDLVESIRKKK